MTERIKRLRETIIDKREKRAVKDFPYSADLWLGISSLPLRMSKRLSLMLNAQDCVFFEDSYFIPARTTAAPPDILTEGEYNKIKETHSVHELGFMSNVCPDYTELIANGTEAHIRLLDAELISAIGERKDELIAMKESLEAVTAFAAKYKAEAEKNGRTDIAEVLTQIPAKGARNLREALQFFRIIHFSLWCEGDYHNIAGRLDQLFYPYYLADIEAGKLTKAEATELVCDFFLTFNADSLLYPGMQQGDNGQSIMLGGRDENGKDMYNELSEIMLTASLELKLIDPKINLRVDKNTPKERFEFASKLTAVGIGFPQYANDDVVIPALERYGYSKKDAANYVVAACWEFIIPGVCTDIANIDAISLLACTDRAVRGTLLTAESVDDVIKATDREIRRTIDTIVTSHDNMWFRPCPLLSAITRQKDNWGDLRHGLKYNNYGIHGTGIAPAADYLSAVKTLVFDEKKISPEKFIEMMDANYEGYESERNMILRDIPRMGNDSTADDIGAHLLSVFAGALEGKKNERGGIWRAGTASAMYYITHANELGATGDGRKQGEYLPANYSPSLNTKLNGPISLIRSFTKPDTRNAMNGGPLTLEFSPSSVNSDEGIKKLAALVQTYIELGGHQLQLNVIDTKSLIDAQNNPEKYKNLIVRVWGWSGYFVELDKVYQDQIIKRSILGTEQ